MRKKQIKKKPRVKRKLLKKLKIKGKMEEVDKVESPKKIKKGNDDEENGKVEEETRGQDKDVEMEVKNDDGTEEKARKKKLQQHIQDLEEQLEEEEAARQKLQIEKVQAKAKMKQSEEQVVASDDFKEKFKEEAKADTDKTVSDLTWAGDLGKDEAAVEKIRLVTEMAAFTRERLGLSLREVRLDQWSNVGEVMVFKDDKMMLEGGDKEADINCRVDQLRDQIEYEVRHECEVGESECEGEARHESGGEVALAEGNVKVWTEKRTNKH